MDWLTIVLVSVLGYAIFGLGTARAVYTREYAEKYPYWAEWSKTQSEYGHNPSYGRDPHKLTREDSSVMEPTIVWGLFWPFMSVWFLALEPAWEHFSVTFAKWFRAPALARVRAASTSDGGS